MGVNSVLLAGYVGNEPQIYSGQDFKSARLSLGTPAFRNKKQVTDWHNVEAYAYAATYIEKYINKGDYVVITGFLSTTTFTGKDNIEKKIYSVKVLTIEKPRVKDDMEQEEHEVRGRSSGYSDSQRGDDDLPY